MKASFPISAAAMLSCGQVRFPFGGTDSGAGTRRLAMLVTVFRSRLRAGVREEYMAMVERMNQLARTMPGYISHKGFFADDGERVTIVEFEHEEGLRAWRSNPEHLAAQKLARQKYYTEYHVQVCTLVRDSKFKAAEAALAAQG
jgi:heme-degrading monooxygenase HmoA